MSKPENTREIVILRNVVCDVRRVSASCDRRPTTNNVSDEGTDVVFLKLVGSDEAVVVTVCARKG